MPLQAIEGRRYTTPPSQILRSEAYNLYRAGRTIGQVARYLGVEFNAAGDMIFERQQELESGRVKRAFSDGRRSLLTHVAVAA